MKIKHFILLAGLISVASVTNLSFADTAERCIALMDKHVKDNALDLSSCNLTAKEAPEILTYLNAHPDITTLDVDNNAYFDDGIALLAKTKTLQTLSASNTNLSKKGFTALSSNQSITHLIDRTDDSIGNDPASDPQYLSGNKKLISVDFNYKNVTNDVLLALANITTLEDINISNASYIDGGAAIALSQLPKLTKLDLSQVYVTDNTGVVIASNANLTQLGILAGSQTITAIANNKNITKLSLSCDKNTVATISGLKNNLSITSLSIAGPISNSTLQTIASMSNLVELNLTFDHEYGGEDVDNMYLIAQLPKLKKLHIVINNFNSVFDIKTAQTLADHSTLTDLYVEDMPESAAMALANIKSLQHLTITNEDPFNANTLELVLNKSLGALASIPSLVELNYSGNFKVDEGVATAMTSNSTLTRVHIDRFSHSGLNMNKISGKAVALLAQAKNLTDLQLASDDIDNAAVIALAGNTAFQHLDLTSRHITDKGIYALASNNSLAALDLKIKPVTASAYNALMANDAITRINVELFNDNNSVKKSEIKIN